MSSWVKLIRHPEEYFRELVVEALRKHRVETRQEVEFYLVSLLGQFMTTDRLYAQDQEGQHQDPPLIFMLKDALEQSGKAEQRLLFRQLGDVALYMGGFFRDHLIRRSVDVGYLSSLGEMAYRETAIRIPEVSQKVIFQELSQRFVTWMEVLSEISVKTTPKTERNLLKVYERWERTESEQAAKALKEAGISPERTNPRLLKKKLQ